MENSSKSSQAYKNAKENALELMYQLKNSYEYQCNARIDDAYNPYKSFMSFIDQFGALKAIGIYSDIESDPGFCKMVDAALNSYEITSETFKPALAYIETFNKTFTYEIVGVIDLGLIAGTATEIAINGVTYSSAAKVDPAKGYDSWSKMKKEIGSAGDGNEWHHIVEQSQQQKSVFSSQLVNNPDNVVSIPSDVHRKITGHYNSKAFSHTKGLTVRDWLAGQSFEAQYKYGLKLLKRFLK